MATVREWVIEQTLQDGRQASVRRLFFCFSLYARKHYSYAATAVKGSDGLSLLEHPVGTPATVDCASLAKALELLLNEYLDDDDAKTDSVGHADGFATKAGSRCFDTKVVGNIRKPGEDLAGTSRCVFKTHYFVRSGSSTKLLLDPCMFTTYSTTDEIKDWLLTPGYAPFDKMRTIAGHPDKFLVMVPSADNKHLKAPGFQESYVMFNFRMLNPDEQKMFFGFRNSGFSLQKYNATCEVTLKKINLLLRNAGIKGQYGFTPRT